MYNESIKRAGGENVRKGVFSFFCCFLLLFSPFCCLTGDAENAPAPAKMRALLIGCDHFLTQEDTWPAAETNLRILSDTLMDDVRRYALIRTSADGIATVSAFEDAVMNAFQSARDQDISLLYISAHGVWKDGGDNAQAGLLLSDGQEEALLTAQELQRILDQVPGEKVVILDACNSGAVIGKGLDGAARAFLSGPGYHVLCSAGGSEASWYFHSASTETLEGASYFATVLCQGLGLLGDYAADQNDDGLVTLTEVYAYLLENYAASTPQIYPQNDGDFVLFAYDPAMIRPMKKAVTDITFEETLLTAGQTEASFSFTVQRQVELYYQIIYHQDGAWQFSQAQVYLDGEQTDGTVLPGRKARTLSLRTEKDASGYVMVQVITLENGQPVFQGGRLLCVQPASGDVSLQVRTAPFFQPASGQELPILIQHDVPCGLTVNILNEDRRVVRRLAYETPSRPQQLLPAGSAFYWDGRLTNGEEAPAGWYTVQVKVRISDQTVTEESSPFELRNTERSGQCTECKSWRLFISLFEYISHIHLNSVR